MKKLFLFLFAILFSVPAFADEAVISFPSGVEIKQGFIIPWENPSNGFMNMSTTTLMVTEAYPPFGAWNALWDGWEISGSWSYDAGTSNVGVMLGRRLGVLSKYLPISYPLADKVDITIFPIGFVVDRPFDDPNFSGASGASILRFDVSF